MVALQEELDWACYHHYGLLADDFCCFCDDLPELVLGQRAFEIVMARRMADCALRKSRFERHGSTPIIEVPSQSADRLPRIG